MFEYTAKMWTENFAKETTIQDKVKKLSEITQATEDLCLKALERYDYDENLALNYLLGG